MLVITTYESLRVQGGGLLNRARARFAAGAALTFVGLGGLFYAMYALYIGSISASPTARPSRGHGRAGAQSDRRGEMPI